METSKNDANSSVPATAGAVTPPVRTIIGRYFDRVASDTSGLTFEEWAPPELAHHAPKLDGAFWAEHGPTPHCVIKSPNEPIVWAGAA